MLLSIYMFICCYKFAVTRGRRLAEGRWKRNRVVDERVEFDIIVDDELDRIYIAVRDGVLSFG